MNRRKRKTTPVVFGSQVSDEALLMQRQIEEPEPENQDFSWLTNRRMVDNAVQPTGRRSKGNSGAYAPLNHQHPTALIPTSDPQQPVENELRFDGGGFLRRRVGNSWQLIPPLASSATPQPTGTASAGTSLDYSRADHSHPTALLLQADSQTPVDRELRLNSNNELVFWDGSAWQPVEIDASNLNNPPTTGITVRQNSGSNVGTRPRLNFIAGTNITITVADDNTDDEIDITINSSAPGNTPYTNTPEPTGIASAGTSNDFSRGDHSHATALIAQTNSQPPVERELRYNSSNALVMRVGSSWVPVKIDWADVLNQPTIPSPSTATPQATGVASAGSSANYSRGDHSHPTALIAQSNSQTPVESELRYNSSNALVMRVGSSWVPVKIDWSDVLNAPNIPSPSNAAPQPTGVSYAGTSVQYSRADHSHATALIAQSNSQTPVERELRYNSSDALVMRVGTAWVPVKVNWGDVLNPPTIPSPSTTTPQPTGTASSGSSANYSRGDHSHPTAILPQSDSQAPVNDEIRYNANNKLVRWNGSAWVELSVESSTAPVQSTSTYTEQGTNDGEIWYRTNDRAFFFRVGNQRVYPAAALFTVSESAVSTGAGNRILLIDSTDNNLLRIGGTVNQTVFAYPKLPVISGQMSSSNANWNTGAGTTPTGALWYNSSAGRPEFYPNATTAEPFFVERLVFNTNSLGVSGFASSLPNGMVRINEGGNLTVKCGDGTYVHGWGGCFDLVEQGFLRAIAGATIAKDVFSGSLEVRTDDIFSNNLVTYIYDKYIELGDTADVPFIILPAGFVHLSSGAINSGIRGYWQLPYVRVSGTNNELWAFRMLLIRATAGTNREVFENALHTSVSPIHVGSQLYIVGGNFSRGWTGWNYWLDGVYQGNTGSVSAGTYLVLFHIQRLRSGETTPRSVVRLRWVSAALNLPINRLRLT